MVTREDQECLCCWLRTVSSDTAQQLGIMARPAWRRIQTPLVHASSHLALSNAETSADAAWMLTLPEDTLQRPSGQGIPIRYMSQVAAPEAQSSCTASTECHVAQLVSGILQLLLGSQSPQLEDKWSILWCVAGRPTPAVALGTAQPGRRWCPVPGWCMKPRFQQVGGSPEGTGQRLPQMLVAPTAAGGQRALLLQRCPRCRAVVRRPPSPPRLSVPGQRHPALQ